MKHIGYFFRSFVPFLIAVLLQLVVSVPADFIYAALHADKESGILDILDAASSDPFLTQTVNLIYGILALLVFVTWYRRVFVLPARRRRKESGAEGGRPLGFSFHNVLALFFLAIGLQYVTTFVVDAVSRLNPVWLENYHSLMGNAGYAGTALIPVVYSVFLAPVVEETLFRGLIFRYARCALPFWLANIWQALLFGLLHMNVLQGVYAFTVGLVLGFICHRGRGIKYGILLHILFNLVGVFYSGLIELTTALSYSLFISIGLALTAFALWLFYTDF